MFTATASAIEGHTVQLTWTTGTGSPVLARAWEVDYQAGGSGAFSAYSDDGVPAAPGLGNALLVSGLSPATAYVFRVTALAPTGCSPSTPVAASATTTTDAGGCVVGLMSLGTPIVLRDAADGNLVNAVTVTIATSGGACTALLSGAQFELPAVVRRPGRDRGPHGPFG